MEKSVSHLYDEFWHVKLILNIRRKRAVIKLIKVCDWLLSCTTCNIVYIFV